VDTLSLILLQAEILLRKKIALRQQDTFKLAAR
jgi:hypothetical protein